jgi:nickel/cobalt transporter (NicO) family protein
MSTRRASTVPFVRVARAVVGAFGILAVLPVATMAHPLGNFTINHYAAIRVAPAEIRLDVVVDQAEIPTFQARLELDTDGDGTVSAGESDVAREPECRALVADLELTVDGHALEPALVAAGLYFPAGSGGLSTMRLVCELAAPLEGGIGGGRDVVLADRSFAGRVDAGG